jgi:hypothetical protein
MMHYPIARCNGKPFSTISGEKAQILTTDIVDR